MEKKKKKIGRVVRIFLNLKKPKLFIASGQ